MEMVFNCIQLLFSIEGKQRQPPGCGVFKAVFQRMENIRTMSRETQ